MRLSFILAAAVLTPLAAAPLAAQMAIPVRFAPGTSSTVINDRIQGRQYKDYKVVLRAGQMLKVNMRTVSGAPYFNVLEPGSNDVAIFIGSTSGGDMEVRTQRNGAYTIRVYQERRMSAGARARPIASASPPGQA